MAVLLIGLFFLQRSIQAPVTGQAEETRAMEIGGWAWSELTGWISLNCENDFDGDGEISAAENTCATVDYRLNVVDVGGNPRIQGCAWSGNTLSTSPGVVLGWICFSNPIGAITQAPVSGVPTSTPNMNALKHDISDPTAFASILNFESMGNDAWKLGFPISSQITGVIGDPNYDADYPSSSNPINGCFNCSIDKILGCSLSPATTCQVLGADCAENEGVCAVVRLEYNCNNCLDYLYYSYDTYLCSISGTACSGGAVCDPGDTCVLHKKGELRKVLGGYTCSNCMIEDVNNICGVNAYGTNINRCDTCQSVYKTPGLMIDNRDNSLTADKAYLCGWAWNSWLNNTYGLGWFQFGPRISTSTRPYMNTEGGSIYSKGNIIAKYRPPFSKYNASYLIESSGRITNFVSGSTVSGDYQGELPYRTTIDFLNLRDNGKYQNILGSVDYIGLQTTADSSSPNKYGSLVVNDPADFFIDNEPLGGKVLYLQELSIDSPLTIYSSSGNTLASGVVLLEGDLVINENIDYQMGSSNISYLKNIPSIVWIVKGDVIVRPNVERIAGTFIVLGNVSSCDPLASHCGQFVSCNDPDLGDLVTCETNPLQVSGNVIARYFNLSRTYYDKDTGAPAELFVNDGRLQANPPPGFVDFSKLVPRFSESPN